MSTPRHKTGRKFQVCFHFLAMMFANLCLSNKLLLPVIFQIRYRCTEAWGISSAGFLVRHLLVLGAIAGSFHTLADQRNQPFSTEQLSENSKTKWKILQTDWATSQTKVPLSFRMFWFLSTWKWFEFLAFLYLRMPRLTKSQDGMMNLSSANHVLHLTACGKLHFAKLIWWNALSHPLFLFVMCQPFLHSKSRLWDIFDHKAVPFVTKKLKFAAFWNDFQ